jgi:hypothetical protein
MMLSFSTVQDPAFQLKPSPFLIEDSNFGIEIYTSPITSGIGDHEKSHVVFSLFNF